MLELKIMKAIHGENFLHEMRRDLRAMVALARGEHPDDCPGSDRRLADKLRASSRMIQRLSERAGSAYGRLEIMSEVSEAVMLAAECDARADAAPEPDDLWQFRMPLPQHRDKIADACRAVLLDWVEPDGAVLRHDPCGMWADDEYERLQIVVGLAFDRWELLPARYANTRSAWRRLEFKERMILDAAMREYWEQADDAEAKDDAPMGPRPYDSDALVLAEESPEAAACRAVLAGAILAEVARAEDEVTATILSIAFGEPQLLPYRESFRHMWRQLNRRQRRLVDAAARAAWPAKGEPPVEGWW